MHHAPKCARDSLSESPPVRRDGSGWPQVPTGKSWRHMPEPMVSSMSGYDQQPGCETGSPPWTSPPVPGAWLLVTRLAMTVGRRRTDQGERWRRRDELLREQGSSAAAAGTAAHTREKIGRVVLGAAKEVRGAAALRRQVLREGEVPTVFQLHTTARKSAAGDIQRGPPRADIFRWPARVDLDRVKAEGHGGIRILRVVRILEVAALAAPAVVGIPERGGGGSNGGSKVSATVCTATVCRQGRGR